MSMTGETIATLRQQLLDNPTNLQAQQELVRLLTEQQCYHDAIEVLEFGIRADTTTPRLLHHYGWLLSTMGRKNEAINALDQSLAVDPDNAGAHYLLSTLKHYEAGDSHVQQMQKALQSASLAPRHRSRILYALGRATEQTGDYATAFDYYRQANDIRHGQSQYNPQAARDSVQRTIEAFTPQLLQQGRGFSSRLPVFLVGMPRSGSSLLEQVLATHPECQAAGEILDLSQIHMNLMRPHSKETPWPENAAAIPVDTWRTLGQAYCQSLHQRFPQAQRISDKQLLNYAMCGVIQLALPEAAIIHCVRDPLDTCLSCYATAFRNDYYGFTCDLEELAQTYLLYDTMMQHWESVMPGKILTMQYESLVANPETEVRRLLQ
ncbi:MAG: hypothetical protein HKN49_04420, partial [Gammaproteobacteria bacterium]|nr:hypothetical protein [Gammaproteobacteria bacterium]